MDGSPTPSLDHPHRLALFSKAGGGSSPKPVRKPLVFHGLCNPPPPRLGEGAPYPHLPFFFSDRCFRLSLTSCCPVLRSRGLLPNGDVTAIIWTLLKRPPLLCAERPFWISPSRCSRNAGVTREWAKKDNLRQHRSNLFVVSTTQKSVESSAHSQPGESSPLGRRIHRAARDARSASSGGDLGEGKRKNRRLEKQGFLACGTCVRRA